MMATAEVNYSSWFEGKDFTSDWLSRKLPPWFDALNHLQGVPARVLDVGSYEGRSCIAFLEYLPYSTVTTVDLFKDPDQERRFDGNVTSYDKRVTKIKGPAEQTFADMRAGGGKFDVIYLDSVKRRDEVYAHSKLAWPLLKMGGVLIWDDLLWRRELPSEKRPEDGIRRFCSEFASCMSVLHDDRQMIVKKTREQPVSNKLSPESIDLPLVSIIVINHNYAKFIGPAIDSVLSQDYPNIEVIVVDNASTDKSVEVIEKHAGGNPRVNVILSPQNDGPMGAGLQGLRVATGHFVCFLDADDYLFETFVSTHVQTHIALPESVACTSNRVVEIDAGGAIITGGLVKSEKRRRKTTRGLRAAEQVVRLKTISDKKYETLNHNVLCLDPSESGWLWTTGAGSANMFRRPIINIACPKLTDRALAARAEDGYYMSIDSYFLYFCHWLGGSALIELPLSAYRIHGKNMKNAFPTLIGFNGSTGPADKWPPRRRRERLRAVLERADALLNHISVGRFWKIVDQASEGRRNELVQRETIEIFAANLPALFARMGMRPAIAALHERLGFRALLRIARRADQAGVGGVRRAAWLAGAASFAAPFSFWNRRPKGK